MIPITGDELVNVPIEDAFLLDVRNGDEFKLSRIAGATCIPLKDLTQRCEEIPKDRRILVYCRSGNRSREAIGLLKAHGFENLVQVEGGIQAYEKAGGKVLRSGTGIPIMQQTQIAAGSLILLSLFLAWIINPLFLILAGLVGAGLTFAGISGYCGMAMLLERLPWNRNLDSSPGKACR